MKPTVLEPPTPYLGPRNGGLGGGTGALFYLTAGQVNAMVTINYNRITGIKIFQSIKKTLPNVFDADSKYINLFNEKIL